MEKYLMIDTETANGLDDPFYYDLGLAVVDEVGQIYETASFVNADIFLDEDFYTSDLRDTSAEMVFDNQSQAEEFMNLLK